MLDRRRGYLHLIADAINPYRWIMAARNFMFDRGLIRSHEFALPTICVGNITVGGTGKTPHTEYLIELLGKGEEIALLSRGYGRKSKGYVKAGITTGMPLIGDEPFQIKNKYPRISVAVCEKRAVGIERLLAEESSIGTVLLDDAYQHRHVKAGLNILLIDSNRPVWRDCVLPFGRLRESISGISRADIVVITKCENITAAQQDWCRSYIKEKKDVPVFFSRMKYGEPYPLFKETSQALEADEVLLVTGIAKPAPLKAEIERRGKKAVLMQYGDHHNFTAAEFGEIAAAFDAIGSSSKAIITTEKDATRLLQRDDLPQTIKENIYVMPIKVEILDGKEEMFNQIIKEYVTENSRNSRIP